MKEITFERLVDDYVALEFMAFKGEISNIGAVHIKNSEVVGEYASEEFTNDFAKFMGCEGKPPIVLDLTNNEIDEVNFFNKHYPLDEWIDTRAIELAITKNDTDIKGFEYTTNFAERYRGSKPTDNDKGLAFWAVDTYESVKNYIKEHKINLKELEKEYDLLYNRVWEFMRNGCLYNISRYTLQREFGVNRAGGYELRVRLKQYVEGKGCGIIERIIDEETKPHMREVLQFILDNGGQASIKELSKHFNMRIEGCGIDWLAEKIAERGFGAYIHGNMEIPQRYEIGYIKMLITQDEFDKIVAIDPKCLNVAVADK